MRSVVRFIALFLLTFVGSAEVVRTSVIPSLQACVCGCGAPSDDLCRCKGPEQPQGPAQPASAPAPGPCSESLRGCSTPSSPASSLTGIASEAEEAATDPEPKPEPRPWPVDMASVPFLASLANGGLGRIQTHVQPPRRCLQRLAWLSVFRK